MITIEQAIAIIADQYGEQQVAEGVAYAEQAGYSDTEDFFSLAISKILYSAEQLAGGARFAVEPGSLDLYFK